MSVLVIDVGTTGLRAAVVRNDGSIGGFFGENDPAATTKKRALLEAEGVSFDASGRVEAVFILRQL